MKPLAALTVFNRLDVTKITLMSLEPFLNQIDLVIVDNGSEPETRDWVHDWVFRDNRPVRLIELDHNIGCPRALNLVLADRLAGQPFIKFDNDVRVLSIGWVHAVKRLVKWWESNERKVGMISAYYEPWQQQRVKGEEVYEGQTVWHIQPVVGHAVWHTPEFLEQVGYFDVLRDDHLYGFEDLILSHKATRLGFELLAWEGWKIENVQRQNALGREGRDRHVEEMRPLYEGRVSRYSLGGSTYTNAHGLPDGGGAR